MPSREELRELEGVNFHRSRKELNEYPWNNVLYTLSKNKFFRIHEKFKDDTRYRKMLYMEGLSDFVYKFSPKSFLGLGKAKKRTRKDAIEFIAKSGLVNKENEAENLLDEIKNNTFLVHPPMPEKMKWGDFFTLYEIRTKSGIMYEATFGVSAYS